MKYTAKKLSARVIAITAITNSGPFGITSGPDGNLGVGESKRRAPGSAEHLPAPHAEVLADFLDVGHEIPSGVVLKRRIGRTLAAATLIEVDDTVLLRMKEAPLFGLRSAARTAMEKYHGLARGEIGRASCRARV